MIWPLLLALSEASLGAPTGCMPVDGERILMSDLAAVDSRFAGAHPGAEAGFSPNPGARRVFWGTELSHLADREGIPATGIFKPICFERRTRLLTQEEIQGSVQKWAAGAQLDLVEQSYSPAPLGDLVIPRPAYLKADPDGTLLLRGYVSWGKNQRFPMWAKVKLRWKQQVIVTTQEIGVNEVISTNQLRIEEREGSIESLEFATSLSDIAGRCSRKRIPLGSPVLLGMLEAPKQVIRGALVKVEVRNGGTYLALDAQAESSGRTGEIVVVRNPASGKSFQARVTGENSAIVRLRSGQMPEQKTK